MNTTPSDFTLMLHSATVRDEGKVCLTINNQSDSVQTYQIVAQQIEGLLAFSPTEQTIQIDPHQNKSATIEVWVRARRGLVFTQLRGKTDYDFDIVVTDTVVEKKVRAHLSSTLSPLFWLVLIGTLFVILGCLVMGSFFILGERIAENQALVTELLALQTIQTGQTAVSSPAHTPTSTPDNSVAETPTPVIIIATESIKIPLNITATNLPNNTPLPPLVYETKEDEILILTLLQDVLDRANGKSLTIQNYRQPTYGFLENIGGGDYTYLPNKDYSGADSFVFEVCDENNLCSSAVANLIIIAVNDPPLATDDALTISEDDNAFDLTAQLLTGDTDQENSILSIVAIQNGHSERVIFSSATGTVQYDPSDFFNYLATGETEVDSFQYTLQDAQGETDTATVTITIQGKNDAPVAQDDLSANNGDGLTVDEDTLSASLAASLLNNDSDADATDQAQLQISTINNNESGGHVSLVDGELRYDPAGAYETLNENETAVDRFTYAIIDPTGAVSNEAIAEMLIIGVSDPPTLTIGNTSAPLLFPPTSPITNSIAIAPAVEIFDVDSEQMGQLIIEFAGSFARPDGQEEYIQITFQNEVITSTNNYIVLDSPQTATDIFISVLQSTTYVNNSAQPAADCRRIEFRLFDESGEASNTETVFIQVSNSVCPTQTTNALFDSELYRKLDGEVG